MTTDGYDYPEDEQLQRVTAWSPTWDKAGKKPHYDAWFEFIKSLWWMPDWGWREYEGFDEDEPVRIFHISTGGWSGNEDLIDAMSDNFICWSQTFSVHRTGGHYEFRIPDYTRKRRKRREQPQLAQATVETGASDITRCGSAVDPVR